jgi:hypothetical protein
MPFGCDLKHITISKCPDTGDILLKGAICANKNMEPIYIKDGSSSTEAVSRPTSVDGTSGAGKCN